MFLVRYTHPDSPAWAHHLEAHTKWLLSQLESGALVASGPVAVESPSPQVARGALLLFDVATPEALDAILATDPYAEQDLVSSCEVTAWDPLFGTFQGRSSLPGRLAQAPLGSLLGGLAG